MYAIVYRSVKVPTFDGVQIKRMLYKARDANENNQITGCIFYGKNQFVQLIEGAKEDLVRLYTEIKNDERHHNVRTLFEGVVTHRMFPDWKMVFFDLSYNKISLIENGIYYNTILSDLLNEELDSPVSLVLNSNIQQL